MTDSVVVNVADIVYREDLYPRIKGDPALVQRYAENLESLPPIEINQHNILIDGWHRWTAHRKAEVETIPAVVTETGSDIELFALAIERNSSHGWQMDEDSKKKSAIRLYNSGEGLDKDEIARVLSVSKRMVRSYLSDTDKRLQEDRDKQIADLWQRCYTQQEIADAVGVSQPVVAEKTKTFIENGSASVFDKSLLFEHDKEFTPPLYNVWTFAKKTNNVGHFGNSEQRIVDNLLYLYTEPFDIVVDPFAGGGSTIDVCRNRMRRVWASDRKPIPERENEIRKLDLAVDGLPPLNRMWSDVSLTYLDPPYWRQAEGQYSNDPTDLANMPLEEFTKTLSEVVKGISAKQSKGVIALIIQPTQWKTDGREFADHITDLIQSVGNKRLILENRISVPYSTEQYNPQQVNWAKENKKLLVISREVIVWRLRNA